MCFPRKPSLGRYSGTREQWAIAFRNARITMKAERCPDPSLSGIAWKAQLIVAYDRTWTDPLAIPALDRLAAKKIIDSILDEESNTPTFAEWN
jgi:hypothetical protein